MLARVIFVTSFLSASAAWPQSMWGTGVYGGMQACGYQQQAAPAAASEDDSVREARQNLSDLQAQLKTKKSEKKKAETQSERAKKDVEKGISDEYVNFVFEHIEHSKRCAEYKGLEATPIASGEEGGVSIPQANMTEVRSFSVDEWRNYCDRGKAGSVSGAICNDGKFQQREGRANVTSCKKGLVEYRKNYALQDKLQGEIEDLEDRIRDSFRLYGI